jgi:hypothetical protein
MTYIEAAITVLEASRSSLTRSEIMAEITRRQLIQIAGQTPGNTLSAALYRNLGKHPRLRREAEQGSNRAKRGSVRWYVVL